VIVRCAVGVEQGGEVFVMAFYSGIESVPVYSWITSCFPVLFCGALFMRLTESCLGSDAHS